MELWQRLKSRLTTGVTRPRLAAPDRRFLPPIFPLFLPVLYALASPPIGRSRPPAGLFLNTSASPTLRRSQFRVFEASRRPVALTIRGLLVARGFPSFRALTYPFHFRSPWFSCRAVIHHPAIFPSNNNSMRGVREKYP